MIVTESELRQQLRRPAYGDQVTIPAGARLSPAAADFVKQFGLEVVDSSAAAQSWDKPSEFPVQLLGEKPICNTCGMSVTEKSSSLTQLNAVHYAPKTHPRIKLRGKIDSLHAMVLLLQRKAADAGKNELEQHLGSVPAYCRELISAEYNERPAAEIELSGWAQEDIHRATHDPQGTLGISHLTIGVHDPELQHWLNVARTMSRELEIEALETFPSPHHAYGASICHALNRLSSVFYFLQLRFAARSA